MPSEEGYGAVQQESTEDKSKDMADIQDDHNAKTSSPNPLLPFREERLSVPTIPRIFGGVTLAFLAGASLGISHGGKLAGMRFRAENAHRFPTTPSGWYLYHKSKNYHVIVGGVKEGIRMGARVGFWTGTFLVIESSLDKWRETKDFISSSIAGFSVASAFSLTSKSSERSKAIWVDLTHITTDQFPLMTAVRTLKSGLYGGILYGLVQDVLGLARGRQLRYVDLIVDFVGGHNHHQDQEPT